MSTPAYGHPEMLQSFAETFYLIDGIRFHIERNKPGLEELAQSLPGKIIPVTSDFSNSEQTVEFAKKIKVVGFDIKSDRVEMMKKGIDPSNELTAEAFKNTDILFTSDPKDLKEASFHIITVPTPINIYNLPDLNPLLTASETKSKIFTPTRF